MGLDMYLEGRKHYMLGNKEMEDGFEVEAKTLKLGYWRKHPNLHGYIVQEFAGGKDECQDIHLDATCLRKIISAIQDGDLPHTEGFFFGQSDPSRERRAGDITIFANALEWVEKVAPMPQPKPMGGGMAFVEVKPDSLPNEFRAVVYRASW